MAGFYSAVDSFAAPLLVTALSVSVLRERVGWRRWSAVSIGFVGVIVMVKPDAGLFDRIAILALTATVPPEGYVATPL